MKRIAFALLFALLGTAAAQSEDPAVGKWKMNPEKTKYEPGPPPQSLTLTIEASPGSGPRYTAEGLTAGGRPFRITFTAYYDGNNWPINGWSVANMASFRRIDARTTERTDKYNGRAVSTSILTVSPDGRELSVIQTSTGFKNTIIYDRQ